MKVDEDDNELLMIVVACEWRMIFEGGRTGPYI